MAATETTEPSVYETPDLLEVESDADSEPPKYDSEYIVNETLDTQSARNAFRSADAENRLVYGPRGLVGHGQQETRSEKLSRLQRELEELKLNEDSESILACMTSDIKSLAEADNSLSSIRSPGKIANQITLESIEKMSLLEQRLTSLESRLGSTTEFNLASQIMTMRTRLAMLTASPDSIGQTAGRIRVLVENAQKLENSDLELRVEELFTSLQRINEVSPTLDLVIDRLRALQKVHETAAQARNDLEFVRASLTSRSEDIEAWRSTLKELEEQMRTGGSIVRNNLSTIKQISSALSKQDLS